MTASKLKRFKAIKNAAYAVYENYVTQSTVFEGTLKGSGIRCSCKMVMKADSPLQNYLLRKMYGDSFTRVRTRMILIPSVKKLVSNPSSDVDFSIASLPSGWESHFDGLYELKSPPIVRQEIDLSDDWAEVKRRFGSTNRNLFNRFVSRSPYTSRVSTDSADFDHFYHRMYVPHCTKQFQDFARVDSYDQLKRYFARGFLLLLSEAGEDVAGAICSVSGDTFVCHRGGVLDGSDEHRKSRVQAALYAQRISYAKEHNLKRIDLGHSRAFFDDGVFRHKSSWGASVSIDRDMESWMYVFNPRSSFKVVAMLQEHPLIVHTPRGLMGYYVSKETDGYSEAELRELLRNNVGQGLAGVLASSPAAKEPTLLTLADLRDEDGFEPPAGPSATGRRQSATV